MKGLRSCSYFRCPIQQGSTTHPYGVLPIKSLTGLQELTESELVIGCQQDDRRCQEALYARFSPRMYAVCLRYARHRAEADDLLQEGFIRAFDKLTSFRMEGSLEGWVRRIMVHTCINHYRTWSRRKEVLGVDHLQEGSVDPVVMKSLGHEELLALVQRLPDGYRMVFNLYAIEGYDHAEIAEMIGCAESTSRSQLSKARQHLMRNMEALNMTEYHERTTTDR